MDGEEYFYPDIKRLNERVVKVSDGVWLLAGKRKIKTPPDPCWIILNQHTGGVLGDDGRSSIYVFSNEEMARNWLVEIGEDDIGYTRLIGWDSMVGKYADTFKDAILDMDSENAWLQFVPLIEKAKFKIRNE